MIAQPLKNVKGVKMYTVQSFPRHPTATDTLGTVQIPPKKPHRNRAKIIFAGSKLYLRYFASIPPQIDVVSAVFRIFHRLKKEKQRGCQLHLPAKTEPPRDSHLRIACKL